MKNYLTIYFTLGILLIPFAIIKYLGIKEYTGAINETLEGVFLMLCIQLFEALFIFLIVKFLEGVFKVSIQSKYLFPILIVLQILILSLVI